MGGRYGLIKRSKISERTFAAAIVKGLLTLLAIGVRLQAQSVADLSVVPELKATPESRCDSSGLADSADLFEPGARSSCFTGLSFASEITQQSNAPQSASRSGDGSDLDTASATPVVTKLRIPKPEDPNRSIYYKNKLEFGLDVGWLPINIPFAFDFLLGDGYTETGLNYTLVPVIASLRWHLSDVKGPVILRGNWDLSFSLSATAIPRGPETRYFSYIMGIRRNFVPRRWKVVPYFDGRLGMGEINAKGPLGVSYAQGQNFTFTLNLGSGARYNINPRYAISAGVNYMHISNLYLSEPKFLNYGINVYGPMVGLDIRVGRHRKDASQ